MNHLVFGDPGRWLTRLAVTGGAAALAFAAFVAPTSAAPVAAAPSAPADRSSVRCVDGADSSPGSESQFLAGRVDVGGGVDLARERAFDRWVTSRGAAAATTGVDVTVYFHNFYRTEAQKLTYQQVLEQLAVLNRSYAGGQGGSTTRFEFKLGSYENVKVSNATIEATSARARRLKAREHEGGRAVLNVYGANRLRYHGDTIRGVATPPWRAARNPQQDGVWIQRGVMTGVAGGPANRADGDALVHEIGHWLGLYHVFQGYCTGTGDRVADTGRMSRASARNPQCGARNTCRHDSGRRDPVHNFMSYSSDACLTTFTAGQATRMSNMWDRYRT